MWKSGLTVLRVGNDDLIRNLESVAMAILKAAGRSVESVTRRETYDERPIG
jgi:hypothetical protein